jgi:2-hydroxy-6-oxonona-2,4-dienedioate hydrolase
MLRTPAAVQTSKMRDVPTGSRRRLLVGGVGVHTWLVGQGEPVVLVHGFGVSGRYMLPLADALAGRFSVFTPDLPGFGRSERPPAPLGIAGLADALGACLDALELERPALVANSLGCQVVTELAVRQPARVGPLVLVGPTVDPEQRLARRQLLRGLSDAGREPLPLITMTARDTAGMGVTALLATFRSALADRIEERLPLIAAPTLVVRGEKDRFVSARWAARVVALLPAARLVDVPGEPHAVHFTQPRLVADLVADLLLEEREESPGELVGGLPHRDVSAREVYEPRAGQRPLPLLGD